ncbi:hypothetical protein KTO58_11670 [Chitinophaga pendula]|uniref:methylenetetrahydrofolate reductase n=1 Tax=Chitinophaga TaxID=79328 RepID=UPI000BB0BE72|nr:MULTISPECIES: hypothetical protein [Chitinophaga]ASZ12574.1 hypothetical protein CK934_17225 [Chitinophaga sp. MD30]UCJ09823.1 hypothetical protein KTO58_11670 [Chitinophaga pendula]
MFLHKIKTGQSGILTYGITPPKSDTNAERIAQIAEKTVARILQLEIDALVVYDVQDESARTVEERPFPYLNALDPFTFASAYLQELDIPKIIYRPAGKFSAEELSTWLDELQQHRFYPVFVGIPSPDFPVKTSLPEAYRIWGKHSESSVIGAVTIPERHEMLKDEDRRILDKANSGVSYFISQCIFNFAYAKQVIEDLSTTCKMENRRIPTIIFTLTACGSAKTLQFLEWLGIHIPNDLKDELNQTDNMLDRSVNICLDIAEKLAVFCAERAVPFGFNIESVAIKKDEIEASIYMVTKIAAMLSEMGIRKEVLLTAQ